MVKSMGTVGAAALFAQLLNFAAAPLLARIYDPGALGNFFVLQSLVLPFAAAIALRWELAVPLPTRAKDALAVAVAAATAVLVLVVSATVLLAAFGSHLIAGFGLPDSRALWATPVLAGSIGAFMISNALALRERRFGAVARRQVLVAVVTVAAQVIGGLVGGGPTTLLLASAGGFLVGSAYIAFSSETLAAGPVSRSDVRRMASRYRKFPFVFAPAGFLNSLGANAPLVLVGAYFTLEEAGQMGMAYKLVAAPVALISVAVSQVFVGELAAIRRDGGGAAQALFLKVSGRLAILGLLAGAVLFFAGPQLFAWLLGEEWRMAGEVSRALCLVTAAQIIVAPTSEVLVVYEKAGTQLALDLLRAAAAVTVVLGCVAVGADLVTLVWVLSLTLMSVYILAWSLGYRVLRRTGDAREQAAT